MRDLCRLITQYGVVYKHRERRQRSKKCVQQKMTPLKCCPSTHHRWSSTNACRGSDSLIGTQSSWPPLFWLPQNCKKKMGTGVRPVHNLLFVPNFAKPGRNQRSFIGKWKFCFFVLFGPFFFFFLFFAPFFALFCPNKSHARIFRGFP